jgi:hypothetical protein
MGPAERLRDAVDFRRVRRHPYGMQLIAAHQILIGSAIALAAIFGLRALVLFSRGGGSVNLALAAASIAVTGALWLYFRKIRARWVEGQREDRPPNRDR